MTKRAKPTRPRRQTSTAVPEPPPLVAAVIRLADPECSGPPDDFAKAYAAMPDVFADTLQVGIDASYALVEQLSGLEQARKDARTQKFTLDRSDKSEYEVYHSPARVIAILNTHDEDHVTDLVTPAIVTGFYVGLAFACYVLTNGAKR